MKISAKSLYKLYSSAMRHPQYRWFIILGTFIYFLSPIDLSPDLFPIVGQFDDVIILGLFFSEIFKIILEFFQPPQISVSQDQGEEQNIKTVDVDAVYLDEDN
jgi:uncharacterized membrane protein YkvA (DUF1232 family)